MRKPTQKQPNYQGGDNIWNKGVNDLAFDYVKDGDHLLNIGSGIKFVFEKKLKKARDVHIYSCDILKPEDLPDILEDYYRKDVEESFTLPRKFNVITAFEILEHLDKTDTFVRSCYNNLEDAGYLLIATPNLASLWGRFELMFGFLPHVIEISNENPNFGTGIFGKRFNNPENEVLHHIRGFTPKAMVEFLRYHNFEVERVIGHGEHKYIKFLFSLFPSIAPINIFVCKKKIN
jgi:SAM-dependent methyltransferase